MNIAAASLGAQDELSFFGDPITVYALQSWPLGNEAEIHLTESKLGRQPNTTKVPYLLAYSM